MNAHLSERSDGMARLKPSRQFTPEKFAGDFTMLRRLTILCLFIAGIAAIAGAFAERKHIDYRGQSVVGSQVRS